MPTREECLNNLVDYLIEAMAEQACLSTDVEQDQPRESQESRGARVSGDTDG